jgi:hypothetical protein
MLTATIGELPQVVEQVPEKEDVGVESIAKQIETEMKGIEENLLRASGFSKGAELRDRDYIENLRNEFAIDKDLLSAEKSVEAVGSTVQSINELEKTMDAKRVSDLTEGHIEDKMTELKEALSSEDPAASRQVITEFAEYINSCLEQFGGGRVDAAKARNELFAETSRKYGSSARFTETVERENRDQRLEDGASIDKIQMVLRAAREHVDRLLVVKGMAE